MPNIAKYSSTCRLDACSTEFLSPYSHTRSYQPMPDMLDLKFGMKVYIVEAFGPIKAIFRYFTYELSYLAYFTSSTGIKTIICFEFF